MYLIIANEEDKQGFCLNECTGRLIRVDVCVKEENNNQAEKTKESNLVSLVK
jgi:hypothetical protein